MTHWIQMFLLNAASFVCILLQRAVLTRFQGQTWFQDLQNDQMLSTQWTSLRQHFPAARWIPVVFSIVLTYKQYVCFWVVFHWSDHYALSHALTHALCVCFSFVCLYTHTQLLQKVFRLPHFLHISLWLSINFKMAIALQSKTEMSHKYCIEATSAACTALSLGWLLGFWPTPRPSSFLFVSSVWLHGQL